jgi:long-chain alkane monooxygenase
MIASIASTGLTPEAARLRPGVPSVATYRDPVRPAALRGPLMMHLNVMTQCSPAPQFEGLWRDPDDITTIGYRSLGYWTGLARKLEAASIDALLLADVHGIYDVYRASHEPSLRHAVQVPSLDPVPVAAAVAAATRRLGVIVTYSTTYHAPYECARLFSSLDHLTGGRAGWNVVSSYLRSAEANGLCAAMSEDERYAYTEEYLAVCLALWESSWDDDAVLRDAASDTFADPDRVHEIRHEGRFFRVRGPHQCEPSPQRTPVIYKAGVSARATEFAARHAEVVFATLPTAEAGAAHVHDLRCRVEAAGRDPGRVRSLQTSFLLVGETRAEVRRSRSMLQRLTCAEGELAKLCGWTGLDVASYPDHLPIRDIPGEEGRLLQGLLGQYHEGPRWTVGDIRSIVRLSRRPDPRTGWLVGTPDQVADQMEAFAATSGVAGFNLILYPPSTGIDDLCDLLVPELRRRGLIRCGDEASGGTLRERYFGAGCRRYA